jgi:hypothetical protein
MLKYKISWQSIQWETSWSMRRTDRQTDMTKLIVAFRSIAIAPKNLCTPGLHCVTRSYSLSWALVSVLRMRKAHLFGSVGGSYVHGVFLPEARYEIAAGLWRAVEQFRKSLGLVPARFVSSESPWAESRATLGHSTVKQAWNIEVDRFIYHGFLILYSSGPSGLLHCGVNPLKTKRFI